jgi:hypothetical protein
LAYLPSRDGPAGFSLETLTIKKYTIMKDLMKIYEKDIMKEKFSVHEALAFGIIVPGMFILLLVCWSIIQAWALR